MFKFPAEIGGIDGSDENVIKASTLHEELMSDPALLLRLITNQKDLIRQIYQSKRSRNKPDFDIAISPVINDGATFCVLHVATSKGRFTEVMEERGFAAMPVNPGDIFNVKDKIFQANCHIPVGGIVYITSDIEGKNKYNGFIAGPHISRIQRQKADKIEKTLTNLTHYQFITYPHQDFDDVLVISSMEFSNFKIEIEGDNILFIKILEKIHDNKSKIHGGIIRAHSLFDTDVQKMCAQFIYLSSTLGV